MRAKNLNDNGPEKKITLYDVGIYRCVRVTRHEFNFPR